MFSRITPCLENGKTAYLKNFPENSIGFGSTEFIVLRERKNISNGLFIYYLVRWKGFRDKAKKEMTGTARQRISPKALSNIKVPLPPLKEQQKIAEILSSLDEKIELNIKMNKTLEEMAKTIFKRWFIDFEFPNEEGKPYKSSGGEFINSELGEIPKGWRVENLDNIAEFLNGLALQKYRPAGKEYLPVIKIRELKQGITSSTEKASPDIDKKYIIR